MIELSNVRAPGWQRVVAELSAPAPDDRIFLSRLLQILGQIAGARQAVFFTLSVRPTDAVEGGSAGSQATSVVEPAAAMVYSGVQAASPSGLDSTPQNDAAVEHLPEVKDVVLRAVASRAITVFSLERADMLYDDSTSSTVVGVPLAGGAPGEAGAGEVRGVITLLLEGRSRQALQTTLALIEVVAGYIHLHGANQNLRRTRQASASLDLAARLIAAINAAPSYQGANIQFVNDLGRQLRCERVSLGWISGGTEPRGKLYCKVIAMSDTENVDRRVSNVQKIEAAMDEAMDQGQPVLYPLPQAQGEGEADFLLAQAVVHAHKELATRDANLRIASLPLRVNDRIVGVVTIETSSSDPISISTIELVQATLDLVAPVLEIRRSDAQGLHKRAYADAMKLAAVLVGPKHTAWKAAGIALSCALLLAAVVPLTYRVGADMELHPSEPRVVSAPFEGTIASLGPKSKPGERVEAGDLLVQMDINEVQLSRLEAMSQITQARKESDERQKRGEIAQAQQAEARADQAEAKLRYFDYRITQSAIKSPISGTIIAGDLRDKTGAAVQLGQQLVQIADVPSLLISAKVDDRDISLIKEGMVGQITTKSDPSREFKFTVERIVPLSEAKEGKNTFEVRCRLDETSPALRPGMQGIAKFDVDRRSLLRIASRRIVDQLRIWLWW